VAATDNISADGRGHQIARLVDLAERAVFVIALLAFYSANIRSQEPINLVVLLNNAITVLFILFRRRTAAVSLNPVDWALAWIGTLLPMLMRPGGEPLIPRDIIVVLVVEGLLIQSAAKFSLNRRFGIGPANRGIQARWAYRFVRHPMYLGYMLTHVGYLLLNPTLYNVCVFGLTTGCQIGRILREESFLLSDPAYRLYAERVRFRLVPLLF
jgi:protein-S-isoprenylcysteine O-methyltransferase Ste14